MHRLIAAPVLLLAACLRYEPPPLPAPREATTVNASAGTTWDAVIDIFATRLIPIRTIERVSGIIATEGLGVDSADGLGWANCGRRGRRRYQPTDAIYNVLVRGDSAKSTVRATVRWSHSTESRRVPECTSTYDWERKFEADVQKRAEAAYSDHSGASHQPTAPTEVPHVTAAPAVPSHTSSSQQVGRLPPTSPADIRPNEQLLENPDFRQAVRDAQRLDVIAAYREFSVDTLTVELGDAAFTSASAEYNLGRLYLAYRGTKRGRTGGALDLRHQGHRVGLYTRSGLQWGNVR
jgi:hypothetical protein